MVRHYERKKPPPSYSQDDLKQALAAIGRGEVTVYKASKIFKIPKPTLYNHITERRGVKSSTSGRAPVFSKEVEEKMAHCIKTMNKWGFGLSKREFLEVVGEFVNSNKLKTPFKDGLPGDDFYQGFSRRHNLSLQKPQAVEVKRKKAVDPFIMDQYFNFLKTITDGLPPSQIYNVDETSFCSDPQRAKVVGEKNTPSHRATSGPGRENTTVLIGGSAAGEKLPPLVIFKGKNIWDSWVASENEGFPGIGFRKGGIFPFNDAVIPDDKFLPEALQRWKALKAAEARPDGESPATAIHNNRTHQLNQNLDDFPSSTAVKIPQPGEGCSSVEPPSQSLGSSSNSATPIEISQPTEGSSLLTPPIPSVGLGPVGGRTFEELLLQQVKQMPLSKLGRKKVCPGAEVITSQEAIERRVEEGNNKKKSAPKKRKMEESREHDVASTSSTLGEDTAELPKGQLMNKKGMKTKPRRNQMKKKGEKQKKDIKKKKKDGKLESTDDEESDNYDSEMNTSDSEDYDFEKETQEVEEEEDFVLSIQKQLPSTGDWVLVKFPTKKSNKIYIGQVAGVDPCLEVKFARKKGNNSVFYWPAVEDRSIVRQDEILKFLPSPAVDKRGRFSFGLTFDGFKIE
ncbi:hypothetical protein GE061_007391 [Apolygus lucorum]|uniref:HTH psq-type domain-containing protein n=1 Tax=Apolygus lucorum TaxID=248454 RepID=A0A8S9WVL4_APOLU|nr:hypothetical protein GE061_007391 [Apolygus lucorum]